MTHHYRYHETRQRPQDIVSDAITHPATSGAHAPAMPSAVDEQGAYHAHTENNANGGPKEASRYSVAVNEAVVEKIAARMVRQIDGIVDLKGSPLSVVQENLSSMPNRSKGAYATVDGDEVSIEVCVILRYGTPAENVFEEVKKRVIPEIEEQTGLKVKELTVRIVSVMDDEEIWELHNKPSAKETASHVARSVGSAFSSAARTVAASVEAARHEASKPKRS